MLFTKKLYTNKSHRIFNIKPNQNIKLYHTTSPINKNNHNQMMKNDDLDSKKKKDDNYEPYPKIYDNTDD